MFIHTLPSFVILDYVSGSWHGQGHGRAPRRAHSARLPLDPCTGTLFLGGIAKITLQLFGRGLFAEARATVFPNEFQFSESPLVYIYPLHFPGSRGIRPFRQLAGWAITTTPTATRAHTNLRSDRTSDLCWERPTARQTKSVGWPDGLSARACGARRRDAAGRGGMRCWVTCVLAQCSWSR